MGGRILPMPSDALRRAEARGKAEGKAEGRAEGRADILLHQIQKKFSRGKSLAEIADELEVSEDKIKPLYEAVEKYGADCAAEDIYEKMIGEDN